MDLAALIREFRRYEGKAVQIRLAQGRIVRQAQAAGTSIREFARRVDRDESSLRGWADAADCFPEPVPGAPLAAHVAVAQAGKDRAWLLALVERHGGKATLDEVRIALGRAPTRVPIVRIVPPSDPGTTFVPLSPASLERTPSNRHEASRGSASVTPLFQSPAAASDSVQARVGAQSRYWQARTCASGALSRLQSLRALLPDLAMADDERDALAGTLTGILTEAAALWRELRADGALDAALRDLTDG